VLSNEIIITNPNLSINMSESKIESEKKTALILKGGGVKGLALVGSISVLSEYGYKFDAYVGTSAGAIVAGLLAVGTTPKELENILRRTTFKSFQDGKWFLRPWTLLFGRYLHPGKEFEDWLEREIKYNYKKNTDFSGIPLMKNLILHDKTRRLTVFAAQKVVGEVKYDSNGDNKDTLMTDAIRYSMSIPIFFKPKTDGIYDGGLLQNFPAERWLNDNPDFDFIGVYLDDDAANSNSTTRGFKRVYEIIQGGVIKYIFEFFMKGVISNVSSIITNRNYVPFINEKRKEVVLIDPSPIGTTDFDLSQKEAEFLVLQGKASTLKHLFDRNLPTEDKRPKKTEVTKAVEKAKKAKGEAEDERKKRTTQKFIKRTVKNIILLSLVVAAFSGGAPIINRGRLDVIYDRAEANKRLNTKESLDSAIKGYDELIGREYKMVSAYDNKGDAHELLAIQYNKLGDVSNCKDQQQKAIDAYTQSIEIGESGKIDEDEFESKPNLVLINRALANRRAGHLKRAWEDYDKACNGKDKDKDKCFSEQTNFQTIYNDLEKTGNEKASEICK